MQRHSKTKADLALRAILATRSLERAYNRLNDLRSALVVALAPDSALEAFGERAYARADRYRAGVQSPPELFGWEERAIETFFPPPAERLVVGGAGDGREALALAAKGYEVVAFEPNRVLAQRMLEGARGLPVSVYRGRYEDLPHLFAVPEEQPARLDDLVPFAAAIIGWGSFSHIRTRAGRLNALRCLAAVTNGPILVSFITVRPDGPASSAGSRLARRARARRGRESSDRFSIEMGFHHPVSADELEGLAAEAGLTVLRLALDPAGSSVPHAVLGLAADAGRPAG